MLNTTMHFGITQFYIHNVANDTAFAVIDANGIKAYQGSIQLGPGTRPASAFLAGGSAIWNSNGYATYILIATNNGTAWISTNRLGP